MNHHPATAVELSGDRVRLREFSRDDVPAAMSIVSDDRVTRWLSFDSRSEAETRAMISGAVSRARSRPRDEYYFAVVTRPRDELVGFARLGLGGVQAAKLGYAIAAAHWNKGYATDAARTLLCYAFDELLLHRVTAAVGPDNHASIAVLGRLGMQYEGRLRHHVFTNGAWRDSLLYSTLVHEWESRTGGDDASSSIT